MTAIKVKWGKETLDLTVDLQSTVLNFKEHLWGLTSVPVERQKLMGVKPNPNGDAAKLADVGISAGKTIMLMGSAGEAPKLSAPPTPQQQSSGQPSAGSPTPRAGGALVGLKNIANTCYMNAAIQMVRMMPELDAFLAAQQNEPLLQPLHQLYKQMNGARESVIPILFWQALIAQNPTFGQVNTEGHPMQHDAEEALSSILTHLYDRLPTSQRPLIDGQLRQTSTCKEETGEPPRVHDSNFRMLSCNINAEVQTLEAGLEVPFQSTNSLHSEALGREALFSNTTRIAALPEYLFVHMVRFSWRADTSKKAKILKPITFPIFLDISALCTEELKLQLEPERAKVMERRDAELERRREARQQRTQSENATPTAAEATSAAISPDSVTALGNKSGYYELCGVISHKGRTADGGHYVFWGKKDGQWMVFDDEHVAPVGEEDVKRLRGIGEAHIAYVLLYRTRDPQTGKTVIPL